MEFYKVGLDIEASSQQEAEQKLTLMVENATAQRRIENSTVFWQSVGFATLLLGCLFSPVRKQPQTVLKKPRHRKRKQKLQQVQLNAGQQLK